jgi:hypothetical protein
MNIVVIGILSRYVEAVLLNLFRSYASSGYDDTVVTVQSSIYTKYTDVPETYLQENSYAIMFKVITFTSNSTTNEMICLKINTKAVNVAAVAPLKTMGLTDLWKLQSQEVSVEASSNIVQAKPPDMSYIIWIIMAVLVFTSITIFTVLLTRKTIFREAAETLWDRFQNAMSNSASTVRSASHDAKMVLNRRLLKFHRAANDDSEYLTLFEEEDVNQVIDDEDAEEEVVLFSGPLGDYHIQDGTSKESVH